MIGSHNMDPRSQMWNSKIALVGDDPGVAAEVLEEMARDFAPSTAWHLTLDDAGKLVWSRKSDVELVELNKDPGTFGWTRFV